MIGFGVVVLGFGCATILKRDLFYENWWGGLVFAPIAIGFGIILICGAVFKPTIFKA